MVSFGRHRANAICLFISFAVSADFIKQPKQRRYLSQLLPSFPANFVDYANGIVAITAGWSP